ncbi:MAG TPA: ATP synthase F1 subunit gamma [Flavobacteriales bacterium]|nr:ATP synthase F1 subunit gamma [Flavobacteriales bacterium]HIN39633.1 ATP synthase F1 subunit gamma [Flavobacteriales bacterium]
MANLKEVRTRITSVSSTQQITSAMKMVSASKLRRAQDAILSLRPYADKLKEILTNLCSITDNSQGDYSGEREIKTVLLVSITSNRGLCGAFNSNVIKLTKRRAEEKYKGKIVSVLSIGKKADDYFKNSELHIIGTDMPKHLFTLYDDLTFDNVAAVAEKIMANYINGQFDHVELIYNKFKNASIQELTAEQYLPVLPPEKEEDSNLVHDYIFEPDKNQIIEELIPKSLKIQLFRAILESIASEHGARMTAMHKATENASDMLKELKITYNKARQASITNELIEIVSGAEALD